METLRCIIFCLALFHGIAAQSQRPPDVTDPDQRPNVLYLNTGNTSENSPLQRNFDTVFQFLIAATPPNGFATCLGYGAFPNTAFAHTACYNTSNQAGCSTCIQGAYANGRSRLTIGFRLWTNGTTSRCNIQYENVNFTSDLPPGTLGTLGPNASVPAPPPTVRTPPASVPASQGRGSSNSTGIIVGVIVGAVVLVLAILAFLLFCRRKFQRRRQGLSRAPSDELQGSSRGAIPFTYQELSMATNDFNERNRIGQGGFGPVYKAVLQDGTPVALKELSIGSQQGKREFVNEIKIITGIRHRNLARLVGYCVDGHHRLLVYEFLEKSSLDRALFGNQQTLDWQARMQIILGVAKGLAYLHEESHIQIIHRDIKPSNILLDKDLQPKISDFGISKLTGMDMGMSDTGTTRVAGTYGYMAPEYALRGRLSTKADVFSFGVVVLEIISGRKCMDETRPPYQEYLLQWAWSLFAAGRMEELIDPRLGENYVSEEATRAMKIALLCTREFEENRPRMSAVVAMLMGYLEVEEVSTVETPGFFGQVRQQNGSSTGTTSSSSEWTGSIVNPR